MTAINELLRWFGREPCEDCEDELVRKCAKVMEEATLLDSVSLSEVADHLADENWFEEVPNGIRKLANLLREEE